MKLVFFAVPVFHPDAAAAELNRFLASHRVAAVERRFVDDGAASAWSVCVTVAANDVQAMGGAQRSVGAAKARGKVDYKEALTAEDFAVYAQLRERRKQVALRDGLPPYGVFNNAQLAQMVTERVRSKASLAAIVGVGPSRVERFGSEFIELLMQLQDGEG